MLRKELEKIPVRVPKRIRNTKKMLFTTQVVKVKNRNVLIINGFHPNKNELEFRYFADQTKKEYAGLQAGEWNQRKLPYLVKKEQYMCCITSDVEFLSKKDEELVRSYLKAEDWESALNAIQGFEWDVNSEKTERAYQNKEKRIEEAMDQVPPLSQEVCVWVRDVVFQDAHYLFVTRKGSRQQGRGACCGGQGILPQKVTHKQETICPFCGRKVTAMTRVKAVERKEQVTVIQKLDREKYVERTFTAVYRSDQKEEIDLMEEIRIFLYYSGEVKIYYGQEANADEFRQDWWTSNRPNKRWKTSMCYPEGLEEALQGTGMEHSGLIELAKKGIRTNYNSYLRYCQRMNYLEYLVKMRFYKLSAQTVGRYGDWGCPPGLNTSGKTAEELLDLDRQRILRLRDMDGGFTALKWLQQERQSGKKIHTEVLQTLDTSELDPADCKEILQAAGSVNKMTHYLQKQKYTMKKAAQVWKDYLNMAIQLHLNTQDDIVRFPRDLSRRHDELTENINAQKTEERIKQVNAQFWNIKKDYEHWNRSYGMENSAYLIRPPVDAGEIIIEGQTLHHCVGGEGYLKGMNEQSLAILFLREKEHPEKPYYTIEVKNGQITQWYSVFDRKPEKEKVEPMINKLKARLRTTQSHTA